MYPTFYVNISKSKSGSYIVSCSYSTLTTEYRILDSNSPEKKFSNDYQSGALSFEVFFKNCKLISNCGYFQNYKHKLNMKLNGVQPGGCNSVYPFFQKYQIAPSKKTSPF